MVALLPRREHQILKRCPACHERPALAPIVGRFVALGPEIYINGVARNYESPRLAVLAGGGAIRCRENPFNVRGHSVLQSEYRLKGVRGLCAFSRFFRAGKPRYEFFIERYEGP